MAGGDCSPASDALEDVFDAMTEAILSAMKRGRPFAVGAVRGMRLCLRKRLPPTRKCD